MFGGIDIRTQVIKQAIIQNKNLDEIVSIIVEKLVNFSIYFYKLFNVPVVLWEPIFKSYKKTRSKISLYWINGRKIINSIIFKVFKNEN